MDNRPLKIKALEVAIRDILSAKDRGQANNQYKRWEVFRSDPAFISAVKSKQQLFKS